MKYYIKYKRGTDFLCYRKDDPTCIRYTGLSLDFWKSADNAHETIFLTTLIHARTLIKTITTLERRKYKIYDIS